MAQVLRMVASGTGADGNEKAQVEYVRAVFHLEQYAYDICTVLWLYTALTHLMTKITLSKLGRRRRMAKANYGFATIFLNQHLMLASLSISTTQTLPFLHPKKGSFIRRTSYLSICTEKESR